MRKRVEKKTVHRVRMSRARRDVFVDWRTEISSSWIGLLVSRDARDEEEARRGVVSEGGGVE